MSVLPDSHYFSPNLFRIYALVNAKLGMNTYILWILFGFVAIKIGFAFRIIFLAFNQRMRFYFLPEN